MVNLKFLVVSFISLFNCILGRSITITLDVVDSPIHLKLKYHNVNDEPVTMCAKLYGA